jgi:autophagy-related protein 18
MEIFHLQVFFQLMHMIKDTPPNPQGIMDLSSDDENCFLAFPASSSTGHV